MTSSLPRVLPGDVISSALVNLLLENMEQLTDRVTALERGGPATGAAPLLTGRIPAADVAAGAQMTVSGVNFLVPAQQNTVTLGSYSITQFFASSTDTELIFTLPNAFPGLVLPVFLPLQVHNRNGDSNALTVRVVPSGVIPQGTSSITNRTGALGVIAAGATYTLQYQISSVTDIPENYLLSPVFSQVQSSTETAWKAGAVVLPSGPQLIAPGTPLSATLSVTVPADAQSAGVSLKAESVHNDAELTTTSTPVNLAIGQVPDIDDPRVAVTLPDMGPAVVNARIASIDGFRGIEIRFGQTAAIAFDARFAEAGRYRFAAEIATPGAGTVWTLGAVTPSQPSQEPAGGHEGITVRITSAVTGPSDEKRSLIVRVFRRDDANTTDLWQSFESFPIRGFS